MRAWDIYHEDQEARATGCGLLPRQEYYCTLRDALYGELTATGRSDLLDHLLMEAERGTLTDLYLLDFAALMACHKLIVRGQAMQDTSQYVPYTRSAQGERLAWQDMRPTNVYRMKVTPELIGNLRALHETSRGLLDPPADAVSAPLRTLQRKFDHAQELNRHLAQQNSELIAERDALRQQLTALQEGYISEQLKIAAEARRVQMEKDLAEEYADRRRAAADAYREQYADELRTLEGRRADADREAMALAASVTEEYLAIRGEMAGHLQALQDRLTRQAEAWQHTLFRSESRLLANSYLSLHGLCTGEMVKLLTEAHLQGSPTAVVTRLMRFHNDLHGQLRQMEQAMLRLGLQVIRPEAGAAFDPALHMVSGPVVGTAPVGKTVAGCLAPGVALMKGEEMEMLVKAEVQVRKE